MKFSGIISSLAIASAVSAAALPFAPIPDKGVPVTGSTLSGVVGAVKDTVGQVTGSNAVPVPVAVPATRKRDAVGEAGSLVPVKLPSPAGTLVGTVSNAANHLPAIGDLSTGGVPEIPGLGARDLPATPDVSDVTKNIPTAPNVPTTDVTDLPTTGAGNLTPETNFVALGPILKLLAEDSQKQSEEDFYKHLQLLFLYVNVADIVKILALIPGFENHH